MRERYLHRNARQAHDLVQERTGIGEYLIHESFASVHGYIWTGVTYGDLETVVYNGIRSGVITSPVIALVCERLGTITTVVSAAERLALVLTRR